MFVLQRGAGEGEGAEIEVLSAGVISLMAFFSGRNRVVLRKIDKEAFAYGLGNQDTHVHFVLDGFYGSIFC